jgi:hypothetical protein
VQDAELSKAKKYIEIDSQGSHTKRDSIFVSDSVMRQCASLKHTLDDVLASSYTFRTADMTILNPPAQTRCLPGLHWELGTVNYAESVRFGSQNGGISRTAQSEYPVELAD